ncbi:histone deacetylase [Kitasatospora sp. NPDC004669]|uniref:histone deacetylase n=1 Tax=Kitasatospora sp. NPDC004669 TaxID=3154555 RepID=UPI0033A6A57A
MWTGRGGSDHGGEDPLVRYTAHGSNLHAARFGCYLYGGRPEGAARARPGRRDRRTPRREAALTLPGGPYFAGRSPTRGCGTAFRDPALSGEVPCRAHPVTVGQFSDVAAQETHRSPGADLDLTRVPATGRDEPGPGRYESLLCAGGPAGHPLLAFTSPTGLSAAEPTAPSAAHPRTPGAGLAQSRARGPRRTAGYLAARPGASGHRTPAMAAAPLGRTGDGAGPSRFRSPGSGGRPGR